MITSRKCVGFKLLIHALIVSWCTTDLSCCFWWASTLVEYILTVFNLKALTFQLLQVLCGDVGDSPILFGVASFRSGLLWVQTMQFICPPLAFILCRQPDTASSTSCVMVVSYYLCSSSSQHEHTSFHLTFPVWSKRWNSFFCPLCSWLCSSQLSKC